LLSSQLTDVIVEMASNIMLVDDHILWMSQKEEKACTSIVRSLEKIAAHTLSSNSQHMAVVSGGPGGAAWRWGAQGEGGGGWATGAGSLPMLGVSGHTGVLYPCWEGLCLCQGVSGHARADGHPVIAVPGRIHATSPSRRTW